jgi:hypothetical protein
MRRGRRVWLYRRRVRRTVRNPAEIADRQTRIRLSRRPDRRLSADNEAVFSGREYVRHNTLPSIASFSPTRRPESAAAARAAGQRAGRFLVRVFRPARGKTQSSVSRAGGDDPRWRPRAGGDDPRWRPAGGGDEEAAELPDDGGGGHAHGPEGNGAGHHRNRSRAAGRWWARESGDRRRAAA